jgi:hypothetical protein
MSYGYIGDPLVNFNPNNPFLDMLAAIDEPQEGGSVQAGQPPPAAEAAVSRFKLPFVLFCAAAQSTCS